MKIAPGDIVTLRSGGPPMTVEYIVDDSTAFCSWFSRVSEGLWSDAMSSAFKISALEPAEKDL